MGASILLNMFVSHCRMSRSSQHLIPSETKLNEIEANARHREPDLKSHQFGLPSLSTIFIPSVRSPINPIIFFQHWDLCWETTTLALPRLCTFAFGSALRCKSLLLPDSQTYPQYELINIFDSNGYIQDGLSTSSPSKLQIWLSFCCNSFKCAPSIQRTYRVAQDKSCASAFSSFFSSFSDSLFCA